MARSEDLNTEVAEWLHKHYPKWYESQFTGQMLKKIIVKYIEES